MLTCCVEQGAEVAPWSFIAKRLRSHDYQSSGDSVIVFNHYEWNIACATK